MLRERVTGIRKHLSPGRLGQIQPKSRPSVQGITLPNSILSWSCPPCCVQQTLGTMATDMETEAWLREPEQPGHSPQAAPQAPQSRELSTVSEEIPQTPWALPAKGTS